MGSAAQHQREAASPAPGRGTEWYMYENTRLDAKPLRHAEARLGHGEEFKVGSLNVRSIRKATRHVHIHKYMDERGVAILCLQETMVAETTQYVAGDHLYVMSGHGKEEREHAGVGFVFRKDVRRCITGFEVDEEGRIMIVGLDLAPRRLSLISVYAPQSRKNIFTDEDRIGFWDCLRDTVGRCLKKGAVLVMGDCNARIHRKLRGRHVWAPHIRGWECEADRSGHEVGRTCGYK